jgi:hypothetical protein
MNEMVDGNNSNQVSSGEWLARHPSVNLSVNLSATDFNLNQLLVLTCQHAEQDSGIPLTNTLTHNTDPRHEAVTLQRACSAHRHIGAD